MNRKLKRFLLSTALGVAATWPVYAAAQSAAEPQGGTLEEVVVTAQRRDERLQDVPIAVTAISGSKLAAASVVSTSDLAVVTPALTISNTSGFLRPFIRGVGTSSSGAGTENSIATYIDGVYIASQPAALMSLSDIARVEVLKGPQGTLFGRNATGGLIQVVTLTPKDEFAGSASIGYGNYNTVRADGYVTGPIAENLLASLTVGVGHQGDGYGHTATGRDINSADVDLAVRGRLLWHASDTTDVTLTADHAQLRGVVVLAVATAGQDRGALAPPRVGGPFDTDSNVQPARNINAHGAMLRIDHEFPSVNLTSISSVRRMDFVQTLDGDNTPAPQLYFFYDETDVQGSQEFQLSSKADSKVQWVVGANYLAMKAQYDPYIFVFGAPAAPRQLVTTSKQETRSASVFGQATFEVLPATNLTVGARYTDEEREVSGTQVQNTVAGVFTAVLVPQQSHKKHFKPVTWRIALDHKFTDDILGYASWSRGFKSGGFSTQSPSVAGYDPEKLNAYEVGLKTEFLDRRLRINGAAYYYEYSDMQVTAYPAGGGAPRIYNGAQAENYGVDFDAEFAATRNLTLTAGLGLLHSEFTSFPGAQIGYKPVTGGWALTSGSATGNQLPYAPKATFNLGAHYAVQMSRGELSFDVNYLHNSGFFTEPDNRLRQPSYEMINASVAFEADNGWSARVWGKNLADELVATQLFTSGYLASSYAPPRTYGVTIGRKF